MHQLLVPVYHSRNQTFIVGYIGNQNTAQMNNDKAIHKILAKAVYLPDGFANFPWYAKVPAEGQTESGNSHTKQ